MPRNWKTELRIMPGFGMAVLAFCAVAGISVWLTRQLLEELEAVSLRVRVLDQISEAEGALSSAAIAARLYGVNRQDTDFIEWERHVEDLHGHLQAIDDMTRPSPTQRARDDTLTRLIQERCDQTTRQSGLTTIESLWRGVSTLRPLTNVLDDMRAEESAFLSRRNDEAKRSAGWAQLTIVLASTLAMVLVGGALAAHGNDSRRNPYDVILMDMQMPVMDGYTATSKLRAAGYAGAIVALTAHALQEDRHQCLRAGCDEYVSKPVNIPALLGLIARFSGRLGEATVGEKMLANPDLHELPGRFCQRVSENLRKFRELLKQSRNEELRLAAHKLAGAGGAYGLVELTQECIQMGRLIMEGASADRLEIQLGRVHDAYTLIRARSVFASARSA